MSWVLERAPDPTPFESMRNVEQVMDDLESSFHYAIFKVNHRSQHPASVVPVAGLWRNDWKEQSGSIVSWLWLPRAQKIVILGSYHRSGLSKKTEYLISVSRTKSCVHGRKCKGGNPLRWLS